MKGRVVVLGAGMGGLSAALRLARRGVAVTLLEAGPEPGGLAAGFVHEGLLFDGGPYILLDRPGLEWALRALGIELEEHLRLIKIEDVYQVTSRDEAPLRFHADLEATAAGFEQRWPGSGRAYSDFVGRVARTYEQLRPMLTVSRPGLRTLLREGAWQGAPFLLRSLRSVLAASGLPEPVRDAIAIWTHIAGQDASLAPSPMAFVPALIHGVGAFYPAFGIGAIPRLIASQATAAGVEIRYGIKARAVRCAGDRVTGVETEAGEFLDATAVLSNASAIGTYLELVGATPEPVKERLRALPLQSPGVCAYLAVRGRVEPPYLRFWRPGGDALCRSLVLPAVVDPGVMQGEFSPARLIAPMRHEDAERGGEAGQRAYLEQVLSERWWREPFDEIRVLQTRIPAQWGARNHLYRESMNPVMTARFMRQGRIAHRSPHIRGLYLAGSSTHPGQWVSFCAISGVLSADCLYQDLTA
jgi:phytoene dehydrogenase-like protein